MIARWSVDIFQRTEHKNTRPKSLIKIPTFSRNLLFTIIIMRREMSFRLRQAHDTQRDFGSSLKTRLAGKQERETLDLSPMDPRFSLSGGEVRSALMRPTVSLSLSLLYGRELPHRKNALHAVV